MYQLSFKSSSTSPTYDPTANHYLILSRCEGYNLVSGSFDENGFFICFVGWVDGQLQAYHTDDYVAWAILPNSSEIMALYNGGQTTPPRGKAGCDSGPGAKEKGQDY